MLCSTRNISIGYLGENTSKWCWKTTSDCQPNITKRLYFFSLIWIPMPLAYLDFGKIEPAERLLVHTKHNSIQHTLNGKNLQIRIQNIRSRTTSWSRGTLSRNAHFAIPTSFAGSRDRNPPPMLPGSIPDSMQYVAWVCWFSTRLWEDIFFPPGTLLCLSSQKPTWFVQVIILRDFQPCSWKKHVYSAR